jgi:hypothetical protein
LQTYWNEEALTVIDRWEWPIDRIGEGDTGKRYYRHHAGARVLLDTTLLHGTTRLRGMKIAPLGLHTSTETGEKSHDRSAEQEIVLAGEAVETLKRDQRAAIAALRLDVEVLKRCVCQVHPELAAQFETIRATLIREFDPEAS